MKRILSIILCMVLVAAAAPSLFACASNVEKEKTQVENPISSNAYHAAAIDENGILWTWGQNQHGQLGDGTTESRYAPVAIMENVVSVNTTNFGTIAAKSDGTIWAWGEACSFFGDDQLSPLQIDSLALVKNIKAVEFSSQNTYILDGEYQLWEYTKIDNEAPTVKVVMENVLSIAISSNVIAAIKTDGTLWTWGYNRFGQIGNGTDEEYSDYYYIDEAQHVLNDVISVEFGLEHVVALKSDGSVWTWGGNELGQLGNGTMEGQLSPVKVMDSATDIAAGFHHTAALKSDGTLWTWGINRQPVLEETELDFGPTIITEPTFAIDHVADIFAGLYHNTLVKTDGSVWSWGANYYGVLGYEGGEFFESVVAGTDVYLQMTPRQIPDLKLAPPSDSVSHMAYEGAQTILIDNEKFELQTYQLLGENGYPTNYVKLRDLAYLLQGTEAEFNASWSAETGVSIAYKTLYEGNGTELQSIFSGEQDYRAKPLFLLGYNGEALALSTITLTDKNGGDHTYVKLRDLGMALDINVSWSSESGVFIETDKAYSGLD